jgi:receptor expression-enhancing protein 1/2/3/4
MSIISRTVCNVIAFGYPCIASFKSVQKRDPEAHTQWLMYWIAVSFFMVFEMFGEFFMSWLPFYYEVKIIIIIWLSTFRGGEVIYQKLFAPYLIRWEREIDAGIERVSSDVSQHGARYVRSKSVEVMNKMQAMMVTQTLNELDEKKGKAKGGKTKKADMKQTDTKNDKTANVPPAEKKDGNGDDDDDDEWGAPDALSDDEDEDDSPKLRQRKSASRRHK